MYKRDFLRDDCLISNEYFCLIEKAIEYKENRQLLKESNNRPLEHKSVAVIFDKNSTRTRTSFEVGVFELGGHPLIINSENSQMSRGESVSDTAKVLENMVDLIVWRTYEQSKVEEMAKIAKVPVINSLTDSFHPCQVLADLSCFAYYLGAVDILREKTLVYFGDGSNNMANSFLLACSNLGMNIKIVSPKKFMPDQTILEDAKSLAMNSGSIITITDDIEEGANGGDLIVTDTWHSMGSVICEEDLSEFQKYQVNQKVMNIANKGAVFMHCLPAYRGEEVTSEVIDGENSLVFLESEFRLHAQKALMDFLMSCVK